MLFAYYFCIFKSRFYSLLHLEVANFEPQLQERTLRASFVRKRCDCAAGDAAEHFAPRTAPQQERFDTHDVRRGFADKFARRRSESALQRVHFCLAMLANE